MAWLIEKSTTNEASNANLINRKITQVQSIGKKTMLHLIRNMPQTQ
jgi:hypothetical protein